MHPGDTLIGRVVQLREYAAYVDVGNGFSGMLHVTEMKLPKGAGGGEGGSGRPTNTRSARLRLGDPVAVRVIYIKPGSRSGPPRIRLTQRFDPGTSEIPAPTLKAPPPSARGDGAAEAGGAAVAAPPGSTASLPRKAAFGDLDDAPALPQPVALATAAETFGRRGGRARAGTTAGERDGGGGLGGRLASQAQEEAVRRSPEEIFLSLYDAQVLGITRRQREEHERARKKESAAGGADLRGRASTGRAAAGGEGTSSERRESSGDDRSRASVLSDVPDAAVAGSEGPATAVAVFSDVEVTSDASDAASPPFQGASSTRPSPDHPVSPSAVPRTEIPSPASILATLPPTAREAVALVVSGAPPASFYDNDLGRIEDEGGDADRWHGAEEWVEEEDEEGEEGGRGKGVGDGGVEGAEADENDDRDGLASDDDLEELDANDGQDGDEEDEEEDDLDDELDDTLADELLSASSSDDVDEDEDADRAAFASEAFSDASAASDAESDDWPPMRYGAELYLRAAAGVLVGDDLDAPVAGDGKTEKNQGRIGSKSGNPVDSDDLSPIDAAAAGDDVGSYAYGYDDASDAADAADEHESGSFSSSFSNLLDPDQVPSDFLGDGQGDEDDEETNPGVDETGMSEAVKALIADWTPAPRGAWIGDRILRARLVGQARRAAARDPAVPFGGLADAPLRLFLAAKGFALPPDARAADPADRLARAAEVENRATLAGGFRRAARELARAQRELRGDAAGGAGGGDDRDATPSTASPEALERALRQAKAAAIEEAQDPASPQVQSLIPGMDPLLPLGPEGDAAPLFPVFLARPKGRKAREVQWRQAVQRMKRQERDERELAVATSRGERAASVEPAETNRADARSAAGSTRLDETATLMPPLQPASDSHHATPAPDPLVPSSSSSSFLAPFLRALRPPLGAVRDAGRRTRLGRTGTISGAQQEAEAGLELAVRWAERVAAAAGWADDDEPDEEGDDAAGAEED